jgi:hypothetical protein
VTQEVMRTVIRTAYMECDVELVEEVEGSDAL